MHSVGIIIIIIIIGSAGSGFIANERNCILKGNIIVLLSNLSSLDLCFFYFDKMIYYIYNIMIRSIQFQSPFGHICAISSNNCQDIHSNLPRRQLSTQLMIVASIRLSIIFCNCKPNAMSKSEGIWRLSNYLPPIQP